MPYRGSARARGAAAGRTADRARAAGPLRPRHRRAEPRQGCPMRLTNSVRLATTSALAAALAACADPSTPTAPASAVPGPRFITNGTPTGSAYGNVGAVFIDADADGRVDFLCSGGLIAPTVFLTAGHCTDFPAGAQFYVTFAPDVIPIPADLI